MMREQTTFNRPNSGAVAMMHITEDTPPDMLTGAMDLTVHLPTGKSVKMAVERSTPMMDLLVQIATSHHLQLSAYILEALEMAPTSDKNVRVLPYKPNTPIGALDTQHIRVVQKMRTLPHKIGAGRRQQHQQQQQQPFESTFRLKVHLPRNQLYVIRTGQNVTIGEITKKVCYEKNLDAIKYEARHPGNLNEVLDPKLRLSDYQVTEIYLTIKGAGLTQTFSANDIMALRKEEEEHRKQNKSGGGVFSLIFKRGKSSIGSGSLSSDNRSISPTHSDESRSVTPPVAQQKSSDKSSDRPRPPQRKRRPAPKPPQSAIVVASKPSSQISSNSESAATETIAAPLTICHSRNSSDSSGYHEPSTISDHCATTLPRKPKPIEVGDEKTIANGEHSRRSLGNLSKMSVHSKSTSSLILGRKKKAAPPPPPTVKIINSPDSVTSLDDASPLLVVASQQSTKVDDRNPVELKEEDSPVEEKVRGGKGESAIATPSPPKIESEQPKSKESQSIKTESKENVIEIDQKRSDQFPKGEHKGVDEVDRFIKTDIEEVKPTVPLSDDKSIPNASEKQSPTHENRPPTTEKSDVIEMQQMEDMESEWQYRLPSPPSGFRDSSPPLVNERPEEHVSSTSSRTVVTNPELFEKLANLQAKEVREKMPEICNKLTLEHLEKRKSLVYNRELATSLKYAQNKDEDVKDDRSVDTQSAKDQNAYSAPDNALPNFKITTYDNPKSKIDIFEDDSIRSSCNNSKRNSLTTTTTINSSWAPSVSTCGYARRSSCEVKRSEFYRNKSKTMPNQTTTTINCDGMNSGNSGMVTRSESFSVTALKNCNAIKRSKSQVSLNSNKYKKEDAEKLPDADTTLTKSNSLFDVSGLHSLEVMRKIQTTLTSSPCQSLEMLSKPVPVEVTQEPTPATEKASPVVYHYKGPPAINLSTWTERPKTRIAIKEDTDYKQKKDELDSQTVTVNQETNAQNGYNLSHFSQFSPDNNNNNELKASSSDDKDAHQNGTGVRIRVGQPVNSNNNVNTNGVIIKIGPQKEDYSRFGPVAYKKPIAFTNKTPRPHSIAITTTGCEDNQHHQPPVVRSVEYKKPFQNSRSVTHISNNNSNFTFESKPVNNSRASDNESLANNQIQTEWTIGKPVSRVNSYAQNFGPVVKGFKRVETVKQSETNDNESPSLKGIGNRASLFGDVVFRNRQNVYNGHAISNGFNNNRHSIAVDKVNGFKMDSLLSSSIPRVPPPPLNPPHSIKACNPANDRAQLLEDIKKFGGKKGLKTIKG